MDIYPEIELSKEQHNSIEVLRNKSFPEHQVTRSYYKQLPHMRALKYRDDQLVGYMGLDYRVVSVVMKFIKYWALLTSVLNNHLKEMALALLCCLNSASMPQAKTSTLLF